MKRFIIHFTTDGQEDSLYIERDTIEECQIQAQEEIKKRSAYNAWSEEI